MKYALKLIYTVYSSGIFGNLKDLLYQAPTPATPCPPNIRDFSSTHLK